MSAMTPPLPVRVPAGSNTGGQFTPSYHGEATYALSPVEDSDESYNYDGTYKFPPHPRSANQLIDFWAVVEVPDAVLENFANTYARDWDSWSAGMMSNWGILNPEPVLSGRKKEWSRAKTQYEQSLPAHRPSRLSRSVVRPLARLARMVQQAKELPEPEREAIMRLPFSLPNGVSGYPKEIYDLYMLSRVPNSLLTGTDDQMASQLQAVTEAVNDLRVSRIAADIYRDGGGTRSMDSAYLLAERSR